MSHTLTKIRGLTMEYTHRESAKCDEGLSKERIPYADEQEKFHRPERGDALVVLQPVPLRVLPDLES